MTFILLLAFFFAPQVSDFNSLYRTGLLALNNDDLPAAQKNLEAASTLQPKNAQVWLALAQTYARQRKNDKADTAARQAEAFAGGNPVMLHALAYYYTQARKPALAASFEERYADRTPDDPEAYSRAMDLYTRGGLPKAAIAAGVRAAAKNRDNAAIHEALAKAYAEDDKLDKADPEFRRALELRPFEESYYFDFSQAYLKKQKFAEALAVLDSARTRFDKSAQIELARGVAFYGLRRFPETIDSFLRTIQIDPQVDQPYLFLGRILELAEDKMPDVAGALASYSSLKPNSYVAQFLYAKALAYQHADPMQYEPLLRKSIQLNGKYWESHFEMGKILEQRGDFPGAAAEYEKSTELNPKEASAHYRLARIYDRLGKPEKAAAERATHQKLTEAEKASQQMKQGMGKPVPSLQ